MHKQGLAAQPPKQLLRAISQSNFLIALIYTLFLQNFKDDSAKIPARSYR